MKFWTSMKHAAWAATILGANAVGASADTIYWDGVTNSPTSPSLNWGDVANWSTSSTSTTPNPGAVPGASDTIVMNVNSDGLGVFTNTSIHFGAGVTRSAEGFMMISPNTTNLRGGTAGAGSVTAGDAFLELGSGGISKSGDGGVTTIGSVTAGGGQNVTVGLLATQDWINNNIGSTARLTIDGPVVVSSTLSNAAITLTLAGTSTATGNSITGDEGVMGNGSGTGNTLAIVKEGSGTWSLASTTVTGLGQHTFSGGVTVTEGILSVSGASSNGGFTAGPLGTGVLIMNG